MPCPSRTALSRLRLVALCAVIKEGAKDWVFDGAVPGPADVAYTARGSSKTQHARLSRTEGRWALDR